MATYCVTKCPKKPLFSKDGLNLLISLILHDKARFCPLGMKIAERPMIMVSELRRGIETFAKRPLLPKLSVRLRF
jgi:hypothetical protein